MTRKTQKKRNVDVMTLIVYLKTILTKTLLKVFLGILVKIDRKEATMIRWIKSKLNEKSTWAGIVMVLAQVGLTVSVPLVQAICLTTAAAVGIYEVVRKEN